MCEYSNWSSFELSTDDSLDEAVLFNSCSMRYNSSFAFIYEMDRGWSFCLVDVEIVFYHFFGFKASANVFIDSLMSALQSLTIFLLDPLGTLDLHLDYVLVNFLRLRIDSSGYFSIH